LQASEGGEWSPEILTIEETEMRSNDISCTSRGSGLSLVEILVVIVIVSGLVALDCQPDDTDRSLQSDPVAACSGE